MLIVMWGNNTPPSLAYLGGSNFGNTALLKMHATTKIYDAPLIILTAYHATMQTAQQIVVVNLVSTHFLHHLQSILKATKKISQDGF